MKTTQIISSEIEIENYHADYFGTPFQPSEVVTKKIISFYVLPLLKILLLLFL